MRVHSERDADVRRVQGWVHNEKFDIKPSCCVAYGILLR
jgi:hypothetical protein